MTAAVAVTATVALTGTLLVHTYADAANISRSGPNIGPTEPGSLVRITPLAALESDIRAVSAGSARIVYRSTDAATGELTEVSGAFFVPTGEAPAAGWPVVALAHRSEGIDTPCAPSVTGNLLGNDTTVATLLTNGYAVTVTDYAGLGEPGRAHDPLDVTSAGRNVIDSVRALRGAYPGISDRWAAFGTGMGGATAWAANQQAARYAPELELVGTAARSPLGDIAPLDQARSGSLTVEQRRALVWSLASLARLHPELDLDDYRRGVAAQNWDDMSSCFGAGVRRGELALEAMAPTDLAPSTPSAASTLNHLIRERALPDAALSAPLSVVNDADDALIASQWNNEPITNACSRGGIVSWRTKNPEIQTNGIGSARDTPIADQIDWLTDRFVGSPPDNGCNSAAVSSAGAGTLLSTEDIPGIAAALGLPAGVRAARVLYGSTQGDTGIPTVVSGVVFAPAGAPPPGGWPALAFGHGTTGIQQDCGPSVLLQGAAPWLANALGPALSRLLDLGFAIGVADYEGLGAPGIHRYLDSRTAGLNMIDSIRALRAAFPGVSTRWAAIGTSQGAGAAWAADEQSQSYATELDLVGAVALAPPADVVGLVDNAVSGAITAEQLGALQLIIASFGRTNPDFDVDEFRRGSALANWDVLSSCSAATAGEHAAALQSLTAADLTPATAEAADQLRGLLAQRMLPQRPMSAPIFIVYGTADRIIEATWTSRAILRACRLGGTISFDPQNGRGHDDLDAGAAVSWLLDRFAGSPVDSDCAQMM